jgi:polyhydroxybutyrate depolymerase
MTAKIRIFSFCLLAALSLTGSAAWSQSLEANSGTPGVVWQTIKPHGQDEERSYAVLVPPSVQHSKKKVPLVMVLHGGGGSADHAMKVSDFSQKAMKEGFVVVYPNGSGRMKDKLLTWNAGHCCGFGMRNKIDDVAFLSEVIDQVAENYSVDTKRVYVTGMSNGGMMTHKLAMERPDKVTAIGPVVASLFGDEKKAASGVAAIIFNGMLDKSVPQQGGSHGGRFADAWDGEPLNIESQAAYWAKVNGSIAKKPKITEDGKVKHLHYDCPGGKNVDMYIVKDSGHAWPGGKQGSVHGDVPSSAVNATDLMWEFFKKQSK